jgi:hypothetical protein
VLIFTVSDVRYRFRINTAPISFQGIGYWLVALVGLATLLTDFWFSNRYPLPWFHANHAWWQLALGATFLFLVLMWLWYSYVSPPIFGRSNAFNFTQTVFSYLLQGNEADLPIVASELTRSASSIVRFAREQPLLGDLEPADSKTETVSQFANDLLLIIAIRKFCRHIIASSPNTAIALFKAMSDQHKYRISIRQFGSNISSEALINKDSLLYHEDEGFYSGYFGYIRPFTNAIYGDYQLVEALSEGNSPLDIDLKVRQALDAQQLGAYTRAVLTTFQGYLKEHRFGLHSYALYRAFDFIKRGSLELYKLNDTPPPATASDITDRLDVVVRFINDTIKALEEDGIKRTILRNRKSKPRGDFYDYVADLMFEVISAAAKVKTGKFLDWHIQHNSVWTQFFNYDDSPTRKIILFKLRRLLYESLVQIDKFPNYRNAPVAGLCLNVTGFTKIDRRGYRREEFPIHRMVIKWTTRRYHWLVRRQPDIAAVFLMSSMTFDEKAMRIIKTYETSLSLVAPTHDLAIWEAIGPIKTE